MKHMNGKTFGTKHLGMGVLIAAVSIGSTICAATYVANNDIGMANAQLIALEHAGVTEAETTRLTCHKDFDNGIFEYDVEFWVGTTEYEYEVSASTGNILGYDLDVEKTGANTASADTQKESRDLFSSIKIDPTDTELSASDIGEAKAKEIALEHAGVTEAEVTSLKIKYDVERGMAEYEVEWNIGAIEYEYTIQATTGTILEHEIELDD